LQNSLMIFIINPQINTLYNFESPGYDPSPGECITAIILTAIRCIG